MRHEKQRLEQGLVTSPQELRFRTHQSPRGHRAFFITIIMDYIEYTTYGKQPGPTVMVIGHVHGNEQVGTRVIDHLKKIAIKRGVLRMIIANPKARSRNTYFIERNLNNAFPGTPDGLYEERLAHHLAGIIAQANFVLDLHSIDKSDGDDMVITTSLSAAHRSLIHSIPIKKVMVVNPAYIPYANNSLINHTRCGVSLEYYEHHGKQKMYQRAYKDMVRILKNLKMVDDSRPAVAPILQRAYSVFASLELPSQKYVPSALLSEECLIKTGDLLATYKDRHIHAPCDFYPLLLKKKLTTKGSTRMCFMTKKIDL